MTIEERISKYLDAIPPCIAGHHGDDQLFKVACALSNGFALPFAEVVSWLVVYNRRCEPMWPSSRLIYKAEQAEQATHTKPRGHLLGSEMSAGLAQKAPARPKRLPMGTSILKMTIKSKPAIDAIPNRHLRDRIQPHSRARMWENDMASMAPVAKGAKTPAVTPEIRCAQIEELLKQGATAEELKLFTAVLDVFEAKPRQRELVKFQQETAEKRKKLKIRTYAFDSIQVHRYPWAMWDAMDRYDNITPEAAEIRLRNGLPKAYAEDEGSPD